MSMDTYEWQKNKAIVDRLYYSETVLRTSLLVASAYTATNMLYIKKGYFANTMRQRIAPVWGATAAFNAVIFFIMLKPLTREEITDQWNKRLMLGKYLYSYPFHLEHGTLEQTIMP